MIGKLRRRIAPLARDTRGLAMLEFVIVLPVLLMLTLTGAELTNYVIVKMRLSQVALHLADNAARIGSGSLLQAKKITEADVNDLLTGAGMQAGNMNLYANGRVIISSLEPMPAPNTNKTFRIRWQRCRGARTGHQSSYGVVGQSSGLNMAGMGMANRLATAPDNGATMFVEVYYEYQPLVRSSLAPSATIIEIASMMVRDRRDLSSGEEGVQQVAGVSKSSC